MSFADDYEETLEDKVYDLKEEVENLNERISFLEDDRIALLRKMGITEHEWECERGLARNL